MLCHKLWSQLSHPVLTTSSPSSMLCFNWTSHIRRYIGLPFSFLFTPLTKAPVRYGSDMKPCTIQPTNLRRVRYDLAANSCTISISEPPLLQYSVCHDSDVGTDYFLFFFTSLPTHCSLSVLSPCAGCGLPFVYSYTLTRAVWY